MYVGCEQLRAGRETLLLESACARSQNHIRARDMPRARAELFPRYCVQPIKWIAATAHGTIRMMFNSKIVLAVSAVLCTPCTAPAKAESLPNIDIQKRCSVRAKATAEMMADKSKILAFDSCMKSEQ